MAYELLRKLFESDEKKLVREVVKTNPEVKSFIETHPHYRIKRDMKFPVASLEDIQVLLNYAGPEELQPKARAAAVEDVRALLRSGGHPESLADQAHLENIALFEVMGAPELTAVRKGEWIYNYGTTYTVESMKAYVDPAERKVVEVTPPAKRTYNKHENYIPQNKRHLIS